MLPNTIGMYVYCSTPGIRDIIITAVYVRTRVVPGTEYSFDCLISTEQPDHDGKSSPNLFFVLSLELLSQSL